MADLGEVAGELLGEEPLGREPTPVEALEQADLAGLEALGVAEELLYGG